MTRELGVPSEARNLRQLSSPMVLGRSPAGTKRFARTNRGTNRFPDRRRFPSGRTGGAESRAAARDLVLPPEVVDLGARDLAPPRYSAGGPDRDRVSSAKPSQMADLEVLIADESPRGRRPWNLFAGAPSSMRPLMISPGLFTGSKALHPRHPGAPDRLALAPRSLENWPSVNTRRHGHPWVLDDS